MTATADLDLGRLYAKGRQRVLEEIAGPEPAVDWRVLDALVAQMDDAGIVDQIVAMYLAELPRRRESVLAARDAEPRALRDAAHSLTASSLTVGALRLGETCRAVENAATAGDMDLARALADEAVKEMDRVEAEFLARNA